MGLLVEGQWHTDWYDTKATQGKFVRKASQFRNWVTTDGSAGPTGVAGFKAQTGRYHLYISLACPWAHRTMVFRALKGLEEMISVSVVNALMHDDGWSFKAGPGVIEDSINQVDFVHQLYVLADSHYSGRVTVPILWDKQQKTIVNNESADIIRMLNSAFDGIGAKQGDYYPQEFHAEIESVNELVYNNVNNGVYKAGFATTQDAYNEAVTDLFAALDKIDARLSKQRYLVGNQITEADWRLFTTLVRFDAVYVGHFKCDRQRIADYPSLSNYLRELYQVPGVKETVDIPHIKAHYYASHETINPTAIIPVGAHLKLDSAHNRAQLSMK